MTIGFKPGIYGNRTMKGKIYFGIMIVLCMSCRGSAINQGPADKPVLLNVQKIWDQGKHNAFTDLIRFRDQWFCTFRDSDRHVGGVDGKIRVIASPDGAAWTSAALIAEAGIDLRDPKFSITPDGRLMIVAGGSVYERAKFISRRPRVLFSKDGTQWTSPIPILTEGAWLWRVTWHKGTAYGTSYQKESEQIGPLALFKSADGVGYEKVCEFSLTGKPNETTLRFLPDDTLLALVRREADDKQAMVGSSHPPYTEWTWRPAGYQVGGPNFIILPDGRMWAAGRYYPEGPKTVLARMGLDRYEPQLTLPSGGDTSYPGMVWHEGLLWMSYYSSHEGKSQIYLAKIQLPKDPPPHP